MVRVLIGGALVAILAVSSDACSRRPPESRIRTVEARIDGITCPTCVPPLHDSLKRQYKQSAIDVSDEKDTATVRFSEHEDFSLSEFRAAVERVRMRVVALHLEACGIVEMSNGEKWLTAGANRFVVKSDGELPLNQPLCAAGGLDSRSNPPVFYVSRFTAQGAPGS